MTTNLSTVTYEKRRGYALVTLNRPGKLNAFTRIMASELIEVFDRTDADDEVRTVIVTGEGRAFCAGADLSEGSSIFENQADTTSQSGIEPDAGGQLTLRIFRSLKPVICAVNGPAVGVGATMQLAMDARIASSAAHYAFVFARRGIMPESASSWFLPRIVGMPTALDWCFSGRQVDADEALQTGLVRSVHEPADLMEAAFNLADQWTAQSAPVSVALSRQLLWVASNARDPFEAHVLESLMLRHRSEGGDVAEGIASFLERRTPNFPDRVSADMPSFCPWHPEGDFDSLVKALNHSSSK